MRLLGCSGQSLNVLVGAGAMLLLAGSSHLSAQPTIPNSGSGFPGFSGSPNDQVRPRLVLGPKGRCSASGNGRGMSGRAAER